MQCSVNATIVSSSLVFCCTIVSQNGHPLCVFLLLKFSFRFSASQFCLAQSSAWNCHFFMSFGCCCCASSQSADPNSTSPRTGVLSMLNMQYWQLWQHCESMHVVPLPACLSFVLFCSSHSVVLLVLHFRTQLRSIDTLQTKNQSYIIKNKTKKFNRLKCKVLMSLKI